MHSTFLLPPFFLLSFLDQSYLYHSLSIYIGIPEFANSPLIHTHTIIRLPRSSASYRHVVKAYDEIRREASFSLAMSLLNVFFLPSAIECRAMISLALTEQS